MRSAALLLCGGALALASGPARATNDNDLQLWRLGNPDSIVVCTRCDGSDRTVKPGSLDAQTRFARMTAALGLAFVPAFQETAGSLGQAGFELGFSGSEAYLRLDPAEWATAATLAVAPPPKVLFVPTLRMHKGLGGSLDLGTAVSYLTSSQMVALSAELRWSVVDGLDYAPDIMVRAWGTRVLGTQELDLTVAGADLTISKSFGVGGMVKLQPYGSYGQAMVNATTGVIDFSPASEDPKDPTSDDGIFHTVSLFSNRYHRFALGVRLTAGAAVLGIEGSLASGTNPVQNDAIVGVPLPTQTTRQYSTSGHVGVSF